MYKISELIGKQSITLLDADSRGIVFSAYFDKGLSRLKHLLLLGGDEETEFLVDYKNLSSIHSDAVVISSAAAIRPAPPVVGGSAASPINLPAFNQDGKSLGFIRDIIMEDSLVSAFVTDEGEIPAGTLLSRSDIMVVFNDTGAPIKLVRPKKSGQRSAPRAKSFADSGEHSFADFGGSSFANFGDEENDSLSVLEEGLNNAGSKDLSASFTASVLYGSDDNSDKNFSGYSAKNGGKSSAQNSAQNPARGSSRNSARSSSRISNRKSKSDSVIPAQAGEVLTEEADWQVGTPQKITPQHAVPPISDINLLKYAFLLGKRLCRSIYTPAGSLVARENDLVTESVIKRAKENGKLVAVALHSL